MKSLTCTRLALNSPRLRTAAAHRVLALWIASAAFGCAPADDLPTSPPLGPKGLPSFTISPRLASGRPKNQDEIFAEIATHVPGYAGTYYDQDGTPVTNLVDLAQSAAAEQAIEPLIRSGKDGKGPLKSKYRKVTYDFIKLKEWKDNATRTLLLRPNVVFVDLDEENNRITVGVSDAGETGPTESFLKQSHIPGVVALMMPVDTSPSPQISPSTLEDLSNTFSLYGGVEINPGPGKVCTLGFNAMLTAGNLSWYQTTYSSDHFFVTNAHCMNSLGILIPPSISSTHSPTRTRV